MASALGKSIVRNEDERYLRGRGEFVADIKRFGMQHVAFVRSNIAHGLIKNIVIPQKFKSAVFTSEDLKSVRPIRADSQLPGFQSSQQFSIARDKVRFVGEILAVCVAPSRAEAEDIAATISAEIDELPAIFDMQLAKEKDTLKIHADWENNVFLETFFESETNIDTLIESAAVSAKSILRTSRQSMAPIELRNIVAEFDNRKNLLTLNSSTQMPHVIKTGLAECLNLKEGDVRVVAPDIGGGFGYKGVLLPEEIIVAWLCMHIGKPVSWVEDRRESLVASTNCREHHYEITGYADEKGKLLAIECEATVDAGAYSIYPFSACLEAAQIASILPGPYDFPGFKCRTWSSATNKPPILPYRGVARTGVCFALETLLDKLAGKLALPPHELRMRNLPSADQMPFINVTNKVFDSGDYKKCLEKLVEVSDLRQIKQLKQKASRNKRIGFGLSIFCEQAAHGTSIYSGWGIPMVPGYEQAFARVSPDGSLDLKVGVQSHGQSLETTLAQIANEILGIKVSDVRVIHGDTAETPYSTGTWGSRCAVMAGGAVASACDVLLARLKTIGGHLLQESPENLKVNDGGLSGKSGSISIADIARVWYKKPQDLPAAVNTGGLEVTEGYRPPTDNGTFSYAAHGCVVEVDLETGETKILKYSIVEDGGNILNPMVADGQVIGGSVQGIGTALFEEMMYDSSAQPLSTSFGEYLIPTAAEVPKFDIHHICTPSPLSRFGQKGIGEGGAIGPPAALGNAINDALKELDAEITEIPVSPQRILKIIRNKSLKRAADSDL